MTIGTAAKKPVQTFSTPPYNEHRAKILYEATIKFCTQHGRKKIDEAEEYKTLFYSFISDVDHKTKKLISSHLSRNRATPRSIAYYLALETIEIAAPFLLMSRVFWERDIMQMMGKLSNSHLLIIARRSDITPAIAGVLIARGDNLINQVLSKNPTLRLNQIAQGNNVTPHANEKSSIDTPVELSQKPVNELMELAQLALTDKQRPNQNPNNKIHDQQNPIAARMLTHANTNNRVMVVRELSDYIGMNFEQVKKIVHHENCESLILFLKGINFKRDEAAQLLVKLNSDVARDESLLNRYLAQYDNFSSSQCRDVMRNLGAKNMNTAPTHQPQTHDKMISNNVASARQRQITKTQGPVLFGTQRNSA
ncbi:MAG: DUF2336 domain-containing protein [Hyphomicrobiales bacterium]|nr:DUF2336 domain-containing protein [Hyphomicrobiales bacterium]